MARLYREEEYVMEYGGPRDRASLIRFVSSVNGAGSLQLESEQELTELRANSTDKGSH